MQATQRAFKLQMRLFSQRSVANWIRKLGAMKMSVRIAGGVLALSMIAWIVMIGAWPIFIGDASSTGSDSSTVTLRANHLLAKQTAYRWIWAIEALGAIGTAFAALVLMGREKSRHGAAPVGWAAICVGATVYIAMYGLMLGTYWPAAQAALDTPAVLASAITGAMALFFLSNIALNAGFTFVFLAESRLQNPAVPNWFAWPAAVLSLMGLVASFAGLVSQPTVSAVSALDAAALIAAVHFALIATFGVRLALESS